MVIRHLPTCTYLGGLVLLASLTACGASDSELDESAEGVIALEDDEESEAEALEAATVPTEDGPRIGAAEIKAPIYEKPDLGSRVIGYLRAGATAPRGEKPVALDDCDGGYYRILPQGYMCVGESTTLDMDHPIIKALTLRPDKSKAMPYPYAFVRAIAPNYYRVPTRKEQLKYEMSLERHLRSYGRMSDEWDALKVGANDIELDEEGTAIGLEPDEPPELDYNVVYGGNGDDEIPWFFDGGRKIPNIASFKVPDYAVITDRIKRKAGLALIGTFMGPNERRFALTTDARLIPTSKLKPDRGSTYHGVSLRGGWRLPLAFVKRKKVYSYDLSRRAFDEADRLDYHLPIQLTGASTTLREARLVEMVDGNWVRDRDVSIAVLPSKVPSFAKDDTKWIDVSINTQTMVLYEGPKPVYATMVSTGRDGLGDPYKTNSTVRGTFRIQKKHVTATMDSQEVGNAFELRDVPWVQYFKGGFAIHAAPWHDDYGKPRSHGCINMAPIDARRVFNFTDPPLPETWHGVYSDEVNKEGTIVRIHP